SSSGPFPACAARGWATGFSERDPKPASPTFTFEPGSAGRPKSYSRRASRPTARRRRTATRTGARRSIPPACTRCWDRNTRRFGAGTRRSRAAGAGGLLARAARSSIRCARIPGSPGSKPAWRSSSARRGATPAFPDAAVTPGKAGLTRSGLEVHATRKAERSGLVGQVTDPGARAALAVQGEEGALVGDVVDVEGHVEGAVPDAEPHVQDVVGRQLRGVVERGLRQGSADRVLPEGIQVEGSEQVVADLREAGTHVLEVRGDVAEEARADRVLVGQRRG